MKIIMSKGEQLRVVPKDGGAFVLLECNEMGVCNITDADRRTNEE